MMPRTTQARPDETDRRALGLIGLAARAGALARGTQEVREAARTLRLHLVLVATDASDNTREKLRPVVEAPGALVIERFDRDALGQAAGKARLSALGVLNPSFAAPLLALLTGDTPESGEG